MHSCAPLPSTKTDARVAPLCSWTTLRCTSRSQAFPCSALEWLPVPANGTLCVVLSHKAGALEITLPASTVRSYDTHSISVQA